MMLNEQLKGYRKKVEAAINRALTDSPEINAAIQKIRDEGYDVFLIVEATIGFNRKEEDSSVKGRYHPLGPDQPGREVSQGAEDQPGIARSPARFVTSHPEESSGSCTDPISKGRYALLASLRQSCAASEAGREMSSPPDV